MTKRNEFTYSLFVPYYNTHIHKYTQVTSIFRYNHTVFLIVEEKKHV